jgi:hypothetical protein
MWPLQNFRQFAQIWFFIFWIDGTVNSKCFLWSRECNWFLVKDERRQIIDMCCMWYMGWLLISFPVFLFPNFMFFSKPCRFTNHLQVNRVLLQVVKELTKEWNISTRFYYHKPKYISLAFLALMFPWRAVRCIYDYSDKF